MIITQDKYVWGWIQAFFSVFVLWGLNNVMIGFSAKVLEANFLVYTCCAFLSCAFILLFVGGPGKLAKETMRSIDTWLFGLIMLLGYLLTLSLFSYVSSTEGSLLQRISLLFGVFFSWLFLSRKPSIYQLVGISFVFIGISVICQNLPVDTKGIIYLLMVLEGLSLTGRMFVAEIHRPHTQALKKENNYKTRARVVGVVMFVMSLFFLSLSFSLALLQYYAPLPMEIGLLPELSDFMHTPSILAGLFAGVFLVAPLRIIEFSSAHIIKTENFLAVAAFSSFSTYFWEMVLSPVTGMSLKTFAPIEMAAMVLITFGSLVAVLGQVKKKSNERELDEFLVKETQDFDRVNDSREILAATLSHFGGDIKKAAEVLNVPEAVVRKMFNDEEQVFAFKQIDKVTRLYRKNVVGRDSLTGLLLRSRFMQDGQRLLSSKAAHPILIYMDLNKFKPVNDKYGHEAGDTVLAEVGVRLNKIVNDGDLAARLGGDEFVLLVSKQMNIKKFIEKIHKIMGAPIDIKKGKKVVVGASIGVACFPDHGETMKELLTYADQAMYRQKRADTKVL